jgi:hypothetical protein
MKQTTLIFILCTALVIIAGVFFATFFFRSASTTGGLSDVTNGFFMSPVVGGRPIINPGVSGTPSKPPENTIVVATREGTLSVRDFTKDDGVWTSADQTYMVVKGTESATSSAENVKYEIVFFPTDKSFVVTLLAEPLGDIRREVVNELLTKLGLSFENLCALAMDVSVPRGVNDFYLGQSLGLSGCPGAVSLPGD